eukprot:m.34380 g.34380  ORF g.34380 m.34380 type:complete len:440 (-) comp12296_c0_seq2:122-1441(-)
MAEESALSLLQSLPPSSLPADQPSDREPGEIATAYKSGLKTVHSMQAGEVCDLLGVDPREGLSTAQADERLNKYSRNELCPIQLNLLGVEDWGRQRYSRDVYVLRDRRFVAINPARIVVGDVVYVGEGQDVPADMRILHASSAQKTSYSLDSNGDWQAAATTAATFLDGTMPCDVPPFRAGNESTKNQAFDKASNIAFRSSTVIAGGLVGLVFATGAQCLVSKLRAPTLKVSPAPKLPRGLDKKKTAKVAAKIATLGLHPKAFENFGAICGTRSMTVIIAVTASLYKELNSALAKIVAMRFRVVLLFSGDVTSDQIRQLPNTAVGKPIDLATIHNFDDASILAESIHRASSESALLAYCNPASMKDVVIAADDKFREPVVMFSNSVRDVLALDRATLGVCDYDAPAHVVQACDAVLGPGGLSRLALYLKVLKESTEVFN